jgi:hypothetical protein
MGLGNPVVPDECRITIISSRAREEPALEVVGGTATPSPEVMSFLYDIAEIRGNGGP